MLRTNRKGRHNETIINSWSGFTLQHEQTGPALNTGVFNYFKDSSLVKKKTKTKPHTKHRFKMLFQAKNKMKELYMTTWKEYFKSQILLNIKLKSRAYTILCQNRSTIFKTFFSVSMGLCCAYVTCVHVPTEVRSQKILWSWSYRQCELMTWVLGTDPSGRAAANSPNHGANSLAPEIYFIEL